MKKIVLPGVVVLLAGCLGFFHFHLASWYVNRAANGILVFDEFPFWSLAKEFGQTWTLSTGGYPTSFQMPGYPVFLSLVGPTWTIVIQFLLSLFSGGILYRWLTRNTTPAMAVITVLLYWLYPINANHLYLLQTESLQISLTTLAVICCLQRKTRLASLLFICVLYLKYSAVLYVSGIIFCFIGNEILDAHPKSLGQIRRVLLGSQYLRLGFVSLAAVSLWWGRNMFFGFPPLGTNSAVNWYIGNNDGIGVEKGEYRHYDFFHRPFFRTGYELEDCLEKEKAARDWRQQQPWARLGRLILNKVLAAPEIFISLEMAWGYDATGRQWRESRTLYAAMYWISSIIQLVTLVLFVATWRRRQFTSNLAVIVSGGFLICHLPYFIFARLLSPLLPLWLLSIGTGNKESNSCWNWKASAVMVGVFLLSLTWVRLGTGEGTPLWRLLKWL